MTPPIRFSRAYRPARSQPRNLAATRATPRSTATQDSPRAQKLPWELRYPSSAVRSLLLECGTTLGAKDVIIYIEVKKPDRLQLCTTTPRDDIFVFCIRTRLHFYKPLHDLSYLSFSII